MNRSLQFMNKRQNSVRVAGRGWPPRERRGRGRGGVRQDKNRTATRAWPWRRTRRAAVSLLTPPAACTTTPLRTTGVQYLSNTAL